MIKLGKFGSRIRIIYEDEITRGIFYMSSQIAIMLNLDVDQYEEMLSKYEAIPDESGLLYFSEIENARKAKEELDNVVLLNTITGFEF